MAAVCAAVLLVAGGVATAKVPRDILTMLRQGKLRRAHRAILNRLYEDPDDPELHAVYAAVLQEGGRDSEALVAFDLSTGSEWYETKGIRYHAIALARVGRSEDAVELRNEFEIGGNLPPGSSLGVRVTQAEDHIIGGRPELAVEAAHKAVEEYPGSPIAFAALTEAYVAAGDLDAAGWAMIRGESLGAEGATAVRLARMRWHIAVGDYDEAWAISEDYRRRRTVDFRLWADRARILRMKDDPLGCLHIAEFDRFQWGVPVDLLLEGSRCAEELGDLELARTLVERMEAGYAAHPDVAQRMHELGMVASP